MPLSVVDASHVPLRVGHVEQVHVAADGRLLAHALAIVDFGLVIAAAAQEVRSTRVEGKCPHGVPIERLEVLEGLQVLVHRREVPDFHSVVEATGHHFGPVAVDAQRLD